MNNGQLRTVVFLGEVDAMDISSTGTTYFSYCDLAFKTRGD
jgi:hypothetical protein